MMKDENYYINGNFTYAVSVTNYSSGPVYKIEPIHSYFRSRFNKEEFDKRDVGGHFLLHPEEKNMLKDYLKMVDENIESILEHNLFPIFAIEDVVEDKELFKELRIFNLSCNLVGKNVLFSFFKPDQFNVDLYYLLHIDRDVAELMMFYILTREYDKGIEYSYKALSHFNKANLFDSLIKLKCTYDIDKNTAKEISKYIADNIDIIKTNLSSDYHERLIEHLSKIISKNKCSLKDNRISDDIDIINFDYNSNHLNLHEEHLLQNHFDIAHYILNKDPYIYTIDPNNKKKGFTFFNYKKISYLYKESPEYYAIVANALLEMIDSNALKVLLKFEHNPLFYIRKKSNLKKGQIDIFTNSKKYLIRAYYDFKSTKYEFRLFLLGKSSSEKL